MRRILVILSIMCAATLSAAASSKDSLWNSAVEQYIASDYQAALDNFLALQEQGYASAELFYNIGNCYYKLDGQLGKVILYYHRSLKVDPAFKDAKFNLDIASAATLDKIDEVPEFIFVTWGREVRDIMSSNSWMVVFIVLFTLTVVLVLLFRFAPRIGVRKLSFFLAIVTLVLAIVAFSFSLSGRSAALGEDEAVVMAPVASVKGAPNANDQSLFILHEGTVVQVIDVVGSWKRIEIADGRQGWIEDRNIEII